ncbi:MAG: glycosyltransferase family 4 protein [Akkermansia sp.]|nr:glycosyltransferase family 4 protein [Akkermansia sp.]
MPLQNRKIYCCTPVAFHANEGFFIRDTGLISRTLAAMGVESKCIMPLPHYEDDQRDGLLRTEYKNLESVTWWQKLNIDALVLYSWGAPRYRRIAHAVKKAGIRLIIHMDCTDDVVGNFAANTTVFTKIVKCIYSRLMDIPRAWHLKQADVITMGLTAAQKLSQRLFYGKWLTDKLYPSPCPVSPSFRYEGSTKKDIILCIGRWEDEFQKRPQYMMQTLKHYYGNGGTAETRIYGNLTPTIHRLHQAMPAPVAAKIKLCGYLPNQQLKEEYNQAKIILCASRYEGSHNVSAEALCCGCSVVTANRPQKLRNLLWYTTRQSGTVAPKDTPEALAEALQTEISAWHQGARNPSAIAAAWQPHFHVNQVFNNILH